MSKSFWLGGSPDEWFITLDFALYSALTVRACKKVFDLELTCTYCHWHKSCVKSLEKRVSLGAA
jgi:hypothetical protein